jgi:DNA-binding transcriptional LysR family regulator
MFARLFMSGGLSLDRLRALVEVGAGGSIVAAARGDPVKQSQYSRQIKELEDFFQAELVERHGKGIRLTGPGKELARISRFFLMGLSNFQRGCLAGDQLFRIGASTTFSEAFLLPLLAAPDIQQPAVRHAVEEAGDDEIERRLHDLTLDFGVVTRSELSRPLQHRVLRKWSLKLWAPAGVSGGPKTALTQFRDHTLPLALANEEIAGLNLPVFNQIEPHLRCDNFLQAKAALEAGHLAALLPDFLGPAETDGRFIAVRVAEVERMVFQYCLAWNPRLLRLNPHAVRRRDALLAGLGLPK